MKDKKAAKLILKRAKKHPELYSKEEIKFAKIFKKKLKLEKKQHEREVSERNSRSGKDDGVRSESEQSKEPRQSKRQWFVELLHKARALVRL
tara:strand:- start:883 stop:1158 length:276 start_codon:yes stop_codon:yes gene_type:complete